MKKPAQAKKDRIQKVAAAVSAPKLEVKKVMLAARGSGLPEAELRKLLMGVNLGQLLTETQLYELSKTTKLERLIIIKQCIEGCDARLDAEGLSDEAWTAINKAKLEYVIEMGRVTTQLGEMMAVKASMPRQPSAHAPGPREQIGTVTAVQVNIRQSEQETPAAHDVTQKIVTLPAPSVVTDSRS